MTEGAWEQLSKIFERLSYRNTVLPVTEGRA